jgi:aryl-alcohol dehydrogenase-like predicted oxidoreductase
VSPIGFGAFKIGRNQGIRYPGAYDLPDEADVARLLASVLDLGITLIDTAPAYGLSEERIGRAIGGRRGEYVLCTKVGETFERGRSSWDFSARAIRGSVERSLLRLRTATIDVLLLHAHGDDVAITQRTDAVATLSALRSAGLVRAIGLSGKTVEGGRRALRWADVLMVEYHLEDVSHAALIEEAASAGVGVLVKKGLASGRLDPRRAIPFVLAAPVSSMVVGGLSIDHLRADVQTAEACGA